jgi:hypothetical protein
MNARFFFFFWIGYLLKGGIIAACGAQARFIIGRSEKFGASLRVAVRVSA